MDQNRFDVLARALSSMPTRRHLLRGLAGGGLGFSSLRLPAVTEARKKEKHKKRQKKVKANAFGCLSVDKTCNNAGQCCSGICEGKKGKRTCRAHGAGTCDQNAPGICEAVDPLQTLCNGVDNCACFRTTAGSNFCVDAVATGSKDFCVNCKKDADCEALGFPPGSACVPASDGNCAASTCEIGMICAVPCGARPPEA